MKFWILIISFLAFGCQTVLNVDVPTIPEKPVLFASFISLEQNHKVQLTKSRPIINSAPNSDFELITNANVELKGNGNTYSFNFDFAQRAYRNTTPFDLVAGQTYLLQATLADGSVLYAQQIMPKSPENVQYSIDSTASDRGTFFNLDLKWSDDESARNFYRIEAYTVTTGDTQNAFLPKEYFEDSKVKSAVFQQKTEVFVFQDVNEPQVDFSLFLVVSEISQDHFEYGTALETYNPGNPFSEPKPLPKNVEGGLGMFTLSGSTIIKLR